MIDKAEACGLAFDQEYIRAYVAPQVEGMLVDSRRSFYRIWPRMEREVRPPDHFHESVHPSVLERIRRLNGGYAPNNRHLEQVFAAMAEATDDFDKAA
jgi:hypothetical protein